MIATEIFRESDISFESAEYLAGFFDVSGSLTVEKNRDYRVENAVKYGYSLRIEVQKTHPEVVDLFKSTTLGYSGDRLLPSGKTADRWIAKAKKARIIMEAIGSHFRLKAGHWTALQENIDPENLKARISELNRVPLVSFKNPITAPYIAGVFDAHGHIDIHDQDGCQTLLAIIMENHEPFIAEIGHYLNVKPFPNKKKGEIKTYKAVLHSTKAADFLEQIQPYSIRHRKTIPSALSFQKIWEANKGKSRSDWQKSAIAAAQTLVLQTKNL